MKTRVLLISFMIIGCCFLPGGSSAEEPAESADQKPILEIGIRPKPTAEELEEMRWADVFANDMARYMFDIQSLKKENPDEVSVLVRAVYRDPAILKQLNQKYAEKLTGGDHALYSEIHMVFRLKEQQYAITEIQVYSKKKVLLSDTVNPPAFSAVPAKTFADTMYQITEKYASMNES